MGEELKCSDLKCGGSMHLEYISLPGESQKRMARVCEICRKIHTVNGKLFTIPTTDEPAYYYTGGKVIGESAKED